MPNHLGHEAAHKTVALEQLASQRREEQGTERDADFRELSRQLAAGKPAALVHGDKVVYGDREMTITREA